MSGKFKDYLRHHWSHFAKVILNPWSIFSIIVVILFACFYKNTLLISICSSIVGGIIASLWFNLSEERLIVARGKVAIRNLKVLFNTIYSTQKRVIAHLKTLRGRSQENCDLPVQYLEEIDHILTFFQEETMNSIETWIDIIPDADIRTKIGEITSQRLQLSALSEELEAVRKERDEATQKSAEIKQYVDREQKLKEKISYLITQLNEKEQQLQSSTLSGITTSGYIAGPIIASEDVGIPGVAPVWSHSCWKCRAPISGRSTVCPSCGARN